MRISIETLGTRGDVQPYLALAVELMRRGHRVQLAAPEQFASFAAERAVPFAGLPGGVLALLDTPQGKAAVAGSQGFGAGFKLLKHVRPLMRRLLDGQWTATRGFDPDVILYHPKAIAGPHIAERLGGIPTILASPLPGFTPTAEFPSPMLPVASLGPLNKVSHQLPMRGAAVLFGKLIGEWRESSLGLRGRSAGLGPAGTIYAYSRHVVPVPGDWDESVLVSGYWFTDEDDWQVPQPLQEFLAEGAKPIYVGFGSMPGLDPGRLASQVIEALAMAGKRGVLATGGGALAAPDVPPHVHLITAAPHARLFEQVSAALHHGGAGTTGASLRAGLPTIICPFFGDQPFWGRRVAALGVGPEPLNRRAMTTEALAAAFRATDDPGMRGRASRLGADIRKENGVSAAADFTEHRARVSRS